MTVSANSRNFLTTIVQIVDPITGEAVKPAYLDIRQRVTATANDDRFIVPTDAFNEWSNLGLNYLRDASAWWIIADLSGVVDAFGDLENAVASSSKLRAPSVQRYLFRILTPQRTST